MERISTARTPDTGVCGYTMSLGSKSAVSCMIAAPIRAKAGLGTAAEGVARTLAAKHETRRAKATTMHASAGSKYLP